MRILITSVVDLRKTSHNRLHQFIKYLSQNHNITVLSINDWWKAGRANVKIYEQGIANILKGVEIKYFTERKFRPYLQEAFSVVILDRLLRQIDYSNFDIHLNYSTLISGHFVAKKLKNQGIPTIYDIADDLPQMIRISPQIPSVLRPLGALIGGYMVTKNIQVSDLVTLSSGTLQSAYHIPEDKSEYIPNGVDTELFRSYLCQQKREKLQIAGCFVLGYVGVLREWVDFEPVFAAVAGLGHAYPDIRILIVGEEGLERNRELARRYGVDGKVLFTGTVPYTQVPQYIACMDVCLIPRKANLVSESMVPLKLFEYMACEKPVICTELGSIKQAVQGRV
ncbi:MAG: glycosyltransferase, partial [Anaerolineales bacterium]|nr:glycosyltransferase [Anaerolineales bacterium]